MASKNLPLALTCGEPAGIGPEISLRAAWELRHEVRTVLLGDAAYLAMLAQDIDPQIALIATSLQQVQNSGLPDFGRERLAVIDCPVVQPVQPGQLNPANGLAVLHTLDVAVQGCQQGWFAGMVTAPLQKSVINDAGVAFSGHTEYLAAACGVEQVVMMLAGPCAALATAQQSAPMLRVALATTHLPLARVAQALDASLLRRVLQIVYSELQTKFGIAQPRILVAGLNPHAGEGGYLGREEIEILQPVLEELRAQGMHLQGPLPADTLFQAKYLQQADCVLAMYHDQGLPVLKFATFGQGVNITLGLPLIRTSVDHGTALDLAARGLGLADAGSMKQAILIAAQMAHPLRT